MNKKIQLTKPNYLDSSDNKDVALGKQAYQSTTASDGNEPSSDAYLAVDGDDESMAVIDQFKWWCLDLGRRYFVETIKTKIWAIGNDYKCCISLKSDIFYFYYFKYI